MEVNLTSVFRLRASLAPLVRLQFAASPHISLRPPPRLPVAISAPSAPLPASRWPPPHPLPASRWPPPRPPPASPPLGGHLRALCLPPRLPVAAFVPPDGRLRTLRLVDSSTPSASRWLPPCLPVVASASSARLPPPGGRLPASRRPHPRPACRREGRAVLGWERARVPSAERL
ncbi:hypothetical protein GUJ93_ZPchr0008g13917 [Zizania palustris]|uniref:Uncharacterized protein n=1 Tax=Zizania palustris TaxID=103762 RepID=A0A8J5RZG8_ZIZPA|nr:hypothetical protein GUJ93_ZPchr0008g13917 [Zizania palustris]